MARFKIATWNINSVRLRIDLVTRFLAEHKPHVLCLQETKTIDDTFPRAAFEAAGYRHMALSGQKNHHGVAIVARVPLTGVERQDWCARTDCRHLRVRAKGDIVIDNFYVPAGGDEPDAEKNWKFAHKLAFLDEMRDWSRSHARPGQKAVLVGDLNVAPLECDVWSHKQLLDVVSHTPAETTRLEAVMEAGKWVDAIRLRVPAPEKLFTWWSYRSPDWTANDRGRRLDHVWVSPELAPAIREHLVLKDARSWTKPSDHVPVMVTLDA
jgi:exodeoxyribonuclease-3